MVAVAAAFVFASLGAPPATAASAVAGGVSASAGAGTASLANDLVARHWAYGATGLTTTSLADLSTGTSWSTSSSNDFTITVDAVSTDSTAWTVTSASAGAVPADPSRPANTGGQQVSFTLQPILTSGLPPGLSLARTYALYPGSPTIEVDTSLLNAGASVVQVKAYSLDEVTSGATFSAAVQAYNAGTDWRDDYRHPTSESGTFDDEGETLRLDDGGGQGWFLVSERRGGVMSRAGRSAGGRTWIGVDDARDLFDAGPLATTPPNYNRVINPTYPAGGRFRTVPPGATLHLGRAYTGVYHGGAGEAARAFAADFFVHGSTPYARSVGINSFHPWGHGAGLNDQNMRVQEQAGAPLGIDSFMLDDQWQGASSGDWNFDPIRFPDTDSDGRPDWIDFLGTTAVEPALWMSPVEFNMSSQVASAHPDWICTPTGQVTKFIQDQAGLGVWDVTNPAFQTYMTDTVIKRAVQDWHVREFKFDFQVWVDCGSHDYLDYEDAFIAMVRRMQVQYPGVTFELDETNDQRAWPFESVALGASWFDNSHTHGSTLVSKLLHDLWSAAPWVPPSSLGFGMYDGYLQAPYTARYLMPMGVLSHFTFWTDLTKVSSADGAETSWWTAWYQAHRTEVSGFVYEDTTVDPLDGTSVLGLQPWNGDRGYLFAFRQNGPDAAPVIPLQGVDPAQSYDLVDVRTGASLGAQTGAQLRQGLAVSLPSAYTSRVISITPSGSALVPETPWPAILLLAVLPALIQRRRRGA
jgi:hypothetical protein